ncbi:MAG: enoyl-CoA hydratase/isomerase family protein [Geminicoccaceae bacterium]
MSEEIRFERRGRLGVAVLDRQSALNALSRGMVQALSAQLAAWRTDPAIGAVLVKAAPGRAFCAGGDVVAVTRQARREGVAAAAPFFRDEYRLNWRVHTFPKPYVALLDGITMGGGVGISVHGAFRIATEHTMFAMPETGIGFFPDVGGTWFLPRCPGEVGMFLGLTGTPLKGADCVHAGLCTHGVPAAALGEVEAGLEGCAAAPDPHSAIAACLAGHAGDIGVHHLPALRPEIDACFGGGTLAEVMAALADADGEAAAEWRAQLAQKSPLALAVTFAQLRRGRALGIEAALRLEYRMVHRSLAGHEFAEGVRALLVDKDRNPRWRPGSLAEVDPAEVEAHFAPLPGGDLAFHWDGA